MTHVSAATALFVEPSPLTNRDGLMTPQHLAEFLGMAVATLSDFRVRRIVPPYLKVGGLVRYRRSDVEPLHQGVDVLGSGLDIRSRGGYIVAPGSEVNGKAYAWCGFARSKSKESAWANPDRVRLLPPGFRQPRSYKAAT